MPTFKRHPFEADGQRLFVSTLAGTIERQGRGNVVWLRDDSGEQSRQQLPYGRSLLDGQNIALSWVGVEGGQEIYASGLFDCIDRSITKAVADEELVARLGLLKAQSLQERIGRLLASFWTFGFSAAAKGRMDPMAPSVVALPIILLTLLGGPALMLAAPHGLVYLLFKVVFEVHYFPGVRTLVYATYAAGYAIVIGLPTWAVLRRRRRHREAIAAIETAINKALVSSAA